MRITQHFRALAIVAGTTAFVGCDGRAYVYDPVDQPGLRERAETKTAQPIRVSASVPGREETRSILGIDLHRRRDGLRHHRQLYFFAPRS